MRVTLSTGLMAILLGAQVASAAPADHSDRLLLLLNLIDQVPDRAALLEAGADDAGEALTRVARDEALPRYPRMRAAGLLALFPSREAKARLAALVDDPAVNDREVRIQGLAALVHLEGPAAFERLAAFARDPDPKLRASALRNLSRIEHPQKQALLQARLAEDGEQEPWIRDLATRALTSR